MTDNQLYPFERNRYYAGKMLTSADFLAEQTYFNNKRRFLNHLMYGEGIVCGCGVFSLDDLSVLVESGVALDGTGREIVIESSVVKKLSAIEGFDTLKTDHVSLCVRYQEKEVQTVYSISQRESGKEYEYNRISEGYQLFLIDKDAADSNYEIENEFLTHMVLFQNEYFEVKLILPSAVCRGKNVKAVVRIEKRKQENKILSYSAILQLPAFLTPKGEHELEIKLENISMEEGEVIVREYWMMAQENELLDTELIVKSGSAKALIDGEKQVAEDGISMKILLTGDSPKELVSREIGRMSLEIQDAKVGGDFICLAELKLVRTESAFIIEEVREAGVKKYIFAPAKEMLRNSYLEYFCKDVDLSIKREGLETSIPREQPFSNNDAGFKFATGILEIPLGDGAKKGEICYSGEIMHGLGKGNVFVEIGYESMKSTIYGNPELFRKERMEAADAETAVKMLRDKGSFIVAAKMLKNVNHLLLTYRWLAIRIPSNDDIEEETDEGKSISVDESTVVMGTRESHFFQVQCHNMESSSIRYELTEPGSGEITSDGVYTAPAKEGVYEIRIYCTDNPFINTYAYAIVKRAGFEE